MRTDRSCSRLPSTNRASGIASAALLVTTAPLQAKTGAQVVVSYGSGKPIRL